MTKVEKLYEKARYYNSLSHAYSNMADELIALAQDMEADNE